MLLYPFMPQTAATIRERLGLSVRLDPGAGGPGAGRPDAAVEAAVAAGPVVPGWEEARWGLLPDGLTVQAGPSLFPRIED